MRNLILGKDSNSIVCVDPAKTIFWVGAGVSKATPCNLPLGNELTDAYLKAALGDDYFKKFILYWNNHMPVIKECVREGEVFEPINRYVYTKEDVNNDNAPYRPRLEFIIGELNKLDHEFERIKFQNTKNEQRYSRGSSLKAIEYFAKAKPNYLHYWIADFVRRGSIVVTANFDICIEKALMSLANVPEPEDCDGIRGIVTDYGSVYHFHGVATDKDIDKNLGATINNVSKGLPRRFMNKIVDWLEDGYSMVFIGYSGLDFFDVQPFFEDLAKNHRFRGKAIYLNYCIKKRLEYEFRREKTYLYLLDPFIEENRIIVYGESENFFEVLGVNSGVECTVEPESISKEEGTAFQELDRYLNNISKKQNDGECDVYHFINLFRILSQLNISPSLFKEDWGTTIRDIYDDWKSDTDNDGVLSQMFKTKNQINECVIEDIRYNNWGSKNAQYVEVVKDMKPQMSRWIGKHGTPLTSHLTWKSRGVSRKLLDEYVDKTYTILKREFLEPRTDEEEDIERDTVHYLCGWQMKKVYALWAVPIVRYLTRPKLRFLLGEIEKLLEPPFTSLRYRTYYLSLCRQRGALKAMLGDKDYDKNGYYGNIQEEWNICMETPNFYDARMVIKARKIQCWIMVLKLNFRGFKRYGTLCKIYNALEEMRADQTEIKL